MKNIKHTNFVVLLYNKSLFIVSNSGIFCVCTTLEDSYIYYI